jgi:hypothetical protein
VQCCEDVQGAQHAPQSIILVRQGGQAEHRHQGGASGGGKGVVMVIMMVVMMMVMMTIR